MARAIFFTLPAHGHVNPTVAVARELVARGEAVTVYSTEEFRAKYADTGADFRCYRGLPEYDVAEVSRELLGLVAFLIRLTERALPLMIEEIRAIRPDYILHDSMAVWGKYAARLLDVPGIASVPTFAFGPEANRGSQRARQMGLRMAGELLRQAGYGLQHWHSAQRLRARWGARNDGLFDMFANREPLNIVYTSREFQPGGDHFGDDFQFVGPSIAPRHDAPDFPFDRLDSRPLLYISLGTVRNQRPDFYRACFAAFGDDAAGRSPYQAVLSTGQHTDPAALGAIPANFIARQYVPQLEVLQRVDLFLTHGGMNSVHEGLYYGVPLLVFPQMAEQALVAAQVAAVGAGLAFPEEGEVAAAELRRAAARVLGDAAFRQTSARLGETLRAAGGYARAVDEILAFTHAHLPA